MRWGRVCGFFQTRILPYKNRIVDPVIIRDNMGQRKPIFGYFTQCCFCFSITYIKAQPLRKIAISFRTKTRNVGAL